ncbi:MAG: hypothetical protein ABI823_09775 [Bryobacteraceae bacterium]
MMTSEGYGDAFRRGFGYTIRYLQARGASRDRAEEVAQAAWSKGWERLTQLRNDDRVAFWVNTIALNEFRRGMRRDSSAAPLEDVCGQIGVDSSPIDAATILKRCHPRDRILFHHQMHGLTTEEMAVAVGATKTAIRIRLLRARRAARRIAQMRSVPQATAATREALQNVA